MTSASNVVFAVLLLQRLPLIVADVAILAVLACWLPQNTRAVVVLLVLTGAVLHHLHGS